MKYVVSESGMKHVLVNGKPKSFKMRTKFESADYKSVIAAFTEIKGGPVGKVEPMTTLEARRIKKAKKAIQESYNSKLRLKRAANEAISKAKESVKKSTKSEAALPENALMAISPELANQIAVAVAGALIGADPFQEIDSEAVKGMDKATFVAAGLEELGSAKQIRKLLVKLYDTMKITPDCSMSDCIKNTLECDLADNKLADKKVVIK